MLNCLKTINVDLFTASVEHNKTNAPKEEETPLPMNYYSSFSIYPMSVCFIAIKKSGLTSKLDSEEEKCPRFILWWKTAISHRGLQGSK